MFAAEIRGLPTSPSSPSVQNIIGLLTPRLLIAPLFVEGNDAAPRLFGFVITQCNRGEDCADSRLSGRATQSRRLKPAAACG